MSKLWMKALLAALATSFAAAQQPNLAVPSPTEDSQAARVKVFAVGPGVTAPQLLPLIPPPIPVEKCKKKVDGKVVLSVIVEAAGRPRNLMFLRPLGTDLDRFALQIVGLDRFTPGTHDGAPVAVALSVEVGMQSCLAEAQDDAGKKSSSLQLRSQPMQKFEPLPQSPEDAVLSSGKSPWQDSAGVPHSERVSGSVSAPVPLFTTEAVYTIEARSARISGKCLVTLIVDRQGMPKSIRMLKTLDPGLDQNAMDAVGRYRFKPAMRNGEPVPVMITVEVNFQLY